MTLISGPLSTVTTTPSAVSQVNISINSPRTQGTGVMTPEVKTVAVTGGVFSSQIAPGPAVLTLLIGGRESVPIPILVDDIPSQTLANAVNAAKVATPDNKEWLEKLAAEVIAGTQGPRGERGPAGPQGAPGPTGPTGPTGSLDLIDESVQTTIDTVAIPAIEGARDEALGQVEGAVESAIIGTGGETVRRMVGITEVTPTPGTTWAHVTEDGARLPLGYDSDGHLDDHARAVWREEVNHIRNVPEDLDIAHAVTTDTGHLLISIQRDGTVEIPGLAVPQQAPPQMVASETYWHPDGTLAPVQARRDLIVGWGASGLEGMLPELTAEFSDLPVTYVNHAKGGESVQHHAMRMGSRPAMIEPVTIPATGPVNVRASNTLPSNQMRPFTGWLAGVRGTMSVTSNQLIFTRTTGGEEVILTEDTKFLPDIDPIYRDATAIFLPGENNLPRNEVDLVKEVTEGMLKYLRPLMPRILVMGLKGNLDFTVDDVRWDRMHQINDFLIDLVGPDHYIDRQAILTGPEIWDLTGLTPTVEDLEYQAAGKMPPSVAADTLHLNNIGDAAIAKVVRARMHTLGWY